MWPVVPFGPLAHVEDLERRVRLHPLAQRRGRRSAPRARCRGAPPASSSCRPPGSRPAVVMPTDAGEARGADAVLVVAAHEHDLLPALGDPRELRAEPRLHRGVRHRLRDVRLVELERRCGRPPRARPRAASCSTWRGVERHAPRPPRVSSGPRLMSTTAWKFGGWGGRLARRPLDEAVLVRPREAARCGGARSRSWRRPSCPSRAPAQRAAEMAGPDLDVCRASVKQPLVQASGRCRARPPSLSTARSGRATSPTNRVSPVSTAHGSGPRARVDQRERRVLGPVPGGVQRAHAHAIRAPAPSRRRRARGRSRAAASRWMWIVAPVAAASRPWPETWSAWLCVSRMCSIDTPM